MLKEFIEHIQKTTQPLITNVNGSNSVLPAKVTSMNCCRPSFIRTRWT